MPIGQVSNNEIPLLTAEDASKHEQVIQQRRSEMQPFGELMSAAEIGQLMSHETAFGQAKN